MVRPGWVPLATARAVSVYPLVATLGFTLLKWDDVALLHPVVQVSCSAAENMGNSGFGLTVAWDKT